MSFRAGQRDAPEDGVNMNRAFPGSATGSISYKIADLVHRLLFPFVHVVIDIHSGGRVARFPLVSSFHEVADEAQHLAMEVAARDFGAPVTMIYQNQTAGLLTSTSERLGKITIGTELGWGQAVNAEGVALARRGILSACIRQGQLHGELPTQAGVPANQQLLVDVSHPACAFLAPYDGHFEPVRLCGETLKQGELVAWLHDFDRLDEAPLPIQAPHDGVIVCLAWEARVFQGQVLSLVGPIRPWRARY